ncbi:MAG: glycosyltransferase family 39 protein [Victivallales bacterium]|nr:glycosyltransferase family 39 protein [Victivallales bacterium]
MGNLFDKLESVLDRRLVCLSVLLLLALCLRAARPFVVDRISKDGVLYVYMARDIASGDMESAFMRNRRMPPLYVFLMAGLSFTGLSAEVSGLVVSVLAGALLVVPVFLIGELMYGRRLAALAAFLVAMNPDLVRLSGSVMRDPLFLLMLFCALFFMVEAMGLQVRRRSMVCWLLCGIFTTLATAVRTEGIVILPVGVLCLAADVFCAEGKFPGFNAKKALASLSCVVVMFAGCYLASLPFMRLLEGSPGTWGLVDKRMLGYLRTLSSDSASGELE